MGLDNNHGNKLVGITLRAVIIGVFCVVALTSVTPYNDYYVDGTYVAGNHFPIGSCFVLLVLILLFNPLLKKSAPGRELSSSELLTIWIMMVVASGIPSSGLFRYLLPVIVAPRYFATPENEWEELFYKYIPSWFTVKDRIAVREFYEGSDVVPWAAWVKPMLFWIPLVLLFYFAMTCLCAILRKQWVEHEKLIFPLVQVPVEMAEKPENGKHFNTFFKNKLMWIGCLIPIIIHTFNGIKMYFPVIPSFPTYFSLYPYFTEKPWTPLRWIALIIYPSVIGISYLLTLEAAFSFWFFHLFFRAEDVITLATGFPRSGWSLAYNQELGAYVAAAGFLLWLSRSHIKKVLLATITNKGRKAKGRGRSKYLLDDSNEPLPYRWTIIGLFVATIAEMLMLMAAGMSFAVTLFVILMFYIILIVVTWVIVDGGLLFITTLIVPSDYLVTALGTQAIRPENHTILAFIERTLMWDSREFLMPSVMNSFKIPDAVQLKRRHISFAMFIAILVAIGVGYYASLKLIYRHGALNLQYWTYMISPVSFLQKIESFMKYPKNTDWTDLSFILIGAAFMLFLCFMRLRFIWCRIHPIGYIAASKWHAHNLWFSIFLGWLFKYLILKHGGVRLYRQLRPLFLGIVVGESFMGGVFIILGLITGRGYRFLPG